MSDDLRRQKEEDIKRLEEMRKREESERADDMCPNPACQLPTALLQYINTNIVNAFGWVECTKCGTVYSPLSLRKQKAALARSTVVPTVVNPQGEPMIKIE